MLADECRRRFATADHVYLATAGADGGPHLVPVVVVVTGDEICFAVDDKPKRTTSLRRLRNIAENPRVAFLADHYDADWSRLWWVRADAEARVLRDGAERERAVEALRLRHRQYRHQDLAGPVVLARVMRWSGWAASP
ncbi:MAG TPA: TIGR03668 family PPOX class F420-dependent oxidoreductase [Actinomycetales bacterium]|nr:TIGR03668 family PPOX class F420-dependent oxidoreductase [Actinomycetales bacterium]